MNWTELTISTTKEGIEPLTGLLIQLGINGFIVEDPEELLAFIEENADTWDIIEDDIPSLTANEPNIKIYISDTAQGEEQLRSIRSGLIQLKKMDTEDLYGNLEVQLQHMQDEDWANNWKQYFKPFAVGKNLVIKPTWEDYDNSDNKLVIQIDPGSSFGSGLHETTQLCLIALEDLIKQRDTVVDVGCGSGILSVAAALLGSEKVIGIDIDESSVITSQESARINQTEDITQFICGDLVTDINMQADIVIANLFANTIIKLLPDIKRILKPKGLFISSGIIEDRLDEVTESYKANGLSPIKIDHIGDWYIVIGQLS